MKKLFLFFGLTILFPGIFNSKNILAQEDFKKDLLAEFLKTDKRKAPRWSGIWSRSSRYAPGTLTIKILSANRVMFEIDALNGANMGEIRELPK